MSEVEVQQWADLARENRVQVARWCGAAAKRGRQKKLWAQAMQDGIVSGCQGHARRR